jgi:hypothetical protein
MHEAIVLSYVASYSPDGGPKHDHDARDKLEGASRSRIRRSARI